VEERCSGECEIVKQEDEFTSVLKDVLETGKVCLDLLASLTVIHEPDQEIAS
jgi:hypothetical protein